MATDTTSLISAATKAAEQYGMEVNPKLLNAISSVSSTNGSYKLPAGAEDDFNDAATFLVNAKYKDSEAIDAAESDQSASLGAKLLKYFNSELTQQDVYELATFAKNYNANIDNIYPADVSAYDNLDDAGKSKYISGVFGIDPETLEISEYGIAAAVRELVKGSLSSDGDAEAWSGEYDEQWLNFITAWEVARTWGIGGVKDSDTINWESKFISYSIDSTTGEYAESDAVGNYASITPEPNENASLSDVAGSIPGGLRKHAIGFYADNPFTGGKMFLQYGELRDYITSSEANNIRIGYFADSAKSEKIIVADAIRSGTNAVARIINYGNALSQILDASNNAVITSTYQTENDGNEDKSTEELLFAEVATDNTTLKFAKLSHKIQPYAYMDGAIGVTAAPAKNIRENPTRKKRMLETAINQRKIYCSASYSSSITTIGSSIGDISENAKMCADSIETMNALSYGKPLAFILRNIVIEVGSPLQNALGELAVGDGIIPQADGYCVMDFSMVYKEFNPEIRSIDGSPAADMIVAYIMSSSSSAHFDDGISTAYSTTQSQMAGDKLDDIAGMYPSDAMAIFGDLHSNPYIIRNSAADDLIAYYAGESISFGTTSSEQEDIRTLLDLYKSCRDYFYRVLMNRSFIHDEKYGMFVRYFIKYLTIDRFMNSRLDNSRDIGKFTLDDCEAFMDSYGLEELADQIRSKYFTSAAEYSKKIIANYSDLMAYKGSKHDIEKCATIFDSGTSDLTLYRYELAKKTDATGSPTLRFAMIDYASENLAHDLSEAYPTATEYSAFTASDRYWDASKLTSSAVCGKMQSPQTTKYLGLTLSSDMYAEYVTTQVSLTVNRFLNGMMRFSADGNIFGAAAFKESMPAGTVFADKCGDEKYGLDVKISLLTLMWKYYVKISECIYAGQSFESSDGGKNKKYFGINRTAKALSDLLEELSINKILGKLNKAYGINGATLHEYATEYDLYMLGNTAGFGYPGIETDFTANEKTNIINSGLKCAIPTQAKEVKAETLSQTEFAAFDNLFAEHHHGTGINGVDVDITQHGSRISCMISAINDALEAASAISFIIKAAKSDDRYDMSKALYYYYKYGGMETEYQDKSKDTYDPETDIGVAYYYEYLYSKISKFAISYLTGEYSDNANGAYDADVKKILDAVYNEYFLTGEKSDAAIGYIGDESDDGLRNLLSNELTSIGIDENSNIKEALIELGIMGDDGKPISYSTTKNEDDGSVSIKADGEDESIGDMSTALSDLLTNIGEMSNHINSAYLAYDEQQLTFASAEDSSNEFEFAQSLVKYFMSYTAYLYAASNDHAYDTKNERIRFASDLHDEIEGDMTDHAFYDYEITIDESEELPEDAL